MCINIQVSRSYYQQPAHTWCRSPSQQLCQGDQREQDDQWGGVKSSNALSSSSLNFETTRTGPKISSRTILCTKRAISAESALHNQQRDDAPSRA